MTDKILVWGAMKEGDRGYFAGLIDGEGTITIRFRIQLTRRFFDCRVEVNNNAKECLDYLKSLTGNNCYVALSSYLKRNRKKRTYKLNIRRKWIIEKLLKELLPYFRIDRKRKLAILLLEFLELHKEVRMNQHPNFKKGEHYSYSQRQFDIVTEMRKLNDK